MCSCDFYRYEHVYILAEGKNFRTFWKETRQLLWTVVTCLLKKC